MEVFQQSGLCQLILKYSSSPKTRELDKYFYYPVKVPHAFSVIQMGIQERDVSLCFLLHLSANRLIDCPEGNWTGYGNTADEF